MDRDNQVKDWINILEASFIVFLLRTHFKNFNKRLVKSPNIYFWRDKEGHEIDCIVEKGKELFIIEIKSAKTFNPNFFDGLKYWKALSENGCENTFVIYAGDENQTRSVGKVLSWKNIDQLLI